MFLFLHTFYSLLPDDIIILPLHETNQSLLVPGALTTMQQELSCIKSSLKQCIEESESKERLEALEFSQVSLDGESVRSEFVSLQMQATNKPDIKVHEISLQDYIEAKMKFEQITDSAVAKFCS
jgi:hypothetical protein